MKKEDMDEYLGLYESDPVSEKELVKDFSPSKKRKKRLKKIRKRLKKQGKALKRLMKIHEAELKDEKQEATTRKQEKSFLSKLGDAVLKAVPMVLVTAVTTAFGFIFKKKTRSGGLQFA